MTGADAVWRVRRAMGMGRLVPLGGPADGAWLTEQAAEPVLRRAAAAVPGVALGPVRITLADADTAAEPAVQPPPSALPPGPLRLDAQVSVWGQEPLPALAAALRAALFAAAADRLGLEVTKVDLQVSELLDAAPESESAQESDPRGVRAAEPTDAAGAAAAATTGVAHLTATMGTAVHLAPDHVRVELATAPDHHPLDVARAVRAAVSAALADDRAVTVLVTSVA
ncbi:hypothetical protein [Streptomyces sp. NPDC002889]|uniref:hypothetical protein n=1 Tax=Streptomyces sp. NPDC002889 TaxID=3364669 RepID=UPI0036D06355